MRFEYGTARHWEEVASSDAGLGSVASEAMIASLCAALPASPGVRVLDVGTGNGALAIELARRGAHAVGIDITAAGIERARTRARACLGSAWQARCEFATMDAERLAFEDRSFAAVACLRMLWCLPRTAACLAEWARVLEPGGTLAVQLYASQRECPLLLLGPRILSQFRDDLTVPPDYRGPFDFDPACLGSLLEAAGFEPLDVREHAIEAELRDSRDYWHTLGSLAGSAYHAFTQLQDEHGAAIEAAWERFATRLRDPDGIVRLGLTWTVCTAVRTRSSRG